MTILFPKTTCRVSKALDRIGRHQFGCEWTGEEINARHLPEPGKMKAAEGKAAEDPDSKGYGAERAAYLRHVAVGRDLRDAIRYEHVACYMVTENGQRINIPGHWLEQPMQLFIGAFLDPATRSRLGLGVDEVKVRDHSGPNLLELIHSNPNLHRELLHLKSAPQAPRFRSKDSRGKAQRAKDPSIAGAKGVLYIDQVALDKRLQEKEEDAAVPRPRGPHRRARNAAKLALDTLYPEGIPNKLWKTLTADVNDWLAKNNESLVSVDTVRRAAKRK